MLSNNDYMHFNQRTLARSITFVGMGIHTGCKVAMSILPAEPNAGINFFRKDAPPGKGFITGKWYNVVETQLATVLGNRFGIKISTVEHLMAALHGCGVDNALIELDGPEVPIMDGSALPFVSLIEKTGIVEQSMSRLALWLQHPIEIQDGDKKAALYPSIVPSVCVEIDFPGTAVGYQTFGIEYRGRAFQDHVADARTFGFSKDIDSLKARGLARGGTLRNAVLVDGNRVVNSEGLRHKNEFARHKVLDAMGDMALIGIPIMARYYGKKPGHALNNALLFKLFEQRDAWTYISIREFYRLVNPNIVQEVEQEKPSVI